MRRFVGGGTLLLLTLLLLAGSVWWDNAVNRGVSSVTEHPRPRWANVARGGVNAHLLHAEVTHDRDGKLLPDNKVKRTFAMIRNAGFHWVRVQFPWEDIEVCGKGQFTDYCRNTNLSTWLKYDYIVQEAEAHGLELIVRLDRPPEWARRAAIATPEVQAQIKAGVAGAAITGPPDRLEDFGDYVAAVAQRYPQLRFFQIWNEPNLQNEWNFRRQEPAELVALLRQARERIRAVNPQAVIVFPALSPTDGRAGFGINDLEYLQGVYDAGGRDTFDIFSAQLYGLGQPPDEHRYIRPGKDLLQPIETRTDVSRVVLLHEIMERNGDGAKAVWVSELGWNSAPAALEHQWGTSVSEEEKARYLVGAMQRAEREWPWMGAMCIWLFRWGGEEPHPQDPTPYFQIVDRDFQPLPAYVAVQEYLRQPPAPPAPRPWTASLPPVLLVVASLAVMVAAAWTLPVFALAAAMLPGAAMTGYKRLKGVLPLGAFRKGVRRLRTLPDRWVLLLLLLSLAWFYHASPQLPLTALGAAFFVPIAIARPDLALLLVPLTVPLYLAPKGVWDERFGIRPSGVFVPLHEVVLLSSVMGVVAHGVLSGGWIRRARIRHYRRSLQASWRELLPILLFVLAGTLGVVIAGSAGRAEALRSWRWLVIEPVLFYCLLRWFGRSLSWRRRLMWAWLGTGVVVSTIGLLQMLGLNLAPVVAQQRCFSESVVVSEGVRRATSVYCHPNNLGLALGRVWPVLLAIGIATVRLRSATLDSWRAGSMPARRAAISIGLAAVVLVGLLASFSKGALIGATGALLVLGWGLRRRLLIGLAAGAVTLALVAGLILGVERLNPLGGSSGARVELWQSGVAMIRDHPIAGIGLDQFLRLRDPERGSPYISAEAAASSERNASHPHNFVLDTVLQTGWLGLVALLAVIGWAVRRAPTRIAARHGESAGLAVGLLAALTAALLHGLVDNFYFVPDLAFSFWIIIFLLGTEHDDPGEEALPAMAALHQEALEEHVS